VARPLIELFAEQEGYCCVWKYLAHPRFAKLTNVQLSERMGVSLRTINEVRSMFHSGGYACRHWANCQGEKG
jgi:hypothetical protein